MYSKILLTLDGSELGKTAVPHAAQLAAGGDTEVIALSVTSSLDQLRLRALTEAYEVDPNQDPNEVAKSIQFVQHREAKEQLEQAEKQLHDAGVKNVRTVVREGLPGNVIIDTAVSEGVGAVVMATRGHSGLGREVVGSVAEYVLRHAGPLAVVLVGPRGGTA